MARISAGSDSIFRITNWLGLNESPDGDTVLRPGEAAVMRNFRITREGHLQIRPGYAPLCTLADAPVRGLWYGWVDGGQHLVAACAGRLWEIDLRRPDVPSDLGAIDDGPAFFFGFGKKLYLLTGAGYYCWDGRAQVRPVEGYVPTVVTAASPAGGGTAAERINLLTGLRRGEYSPDGQATVFRLPEGELDEVVGVEGTDIGWTADLARGTVTFQTAPPEGVNTIAFTWRKGEGNRERVHAMRFAEFYNGASDARIFLYGDGSSGSIYSDLDRNGQPTAEYFPVLNELTAGEENTPITAMIRHYDRLMIFKADCAFSARYDTLQLSDGSVTAAFYATPVNRAIGCAAPGQARLVRNDPRTLFGRSVYTWSLASATRDERNAGRISQRVEATLGGFDPEGCITFDDEGEQEYYIVRGEQALIHNYANDTWYYYTHFPAACMAKAQGEVYFGTPDGRVMHLSRAYRNDGSQPIDAYWESGSMDFGYDWRRKHSHCLWVSLKPENQARVTVSAQSSRRSDHGAYSAAANLACFTHVNFSHWSFRTNRKPQVVRLRLKVKKFTFYKLIFSSCSASATATILAADLRIRTTGNVK